MDSNIKIRCSKKYGFKNIIKRLLFAFEFWCGILIIVVNVNATTIDFKSKDIILLDDYYFLKGDYQIYLNEEGFPYIPVKRVKLNVLDSIEINVIHIDTIYIEKPLLPIPKKQIKRYAKREYIKDFFVYSSNTPIIDRDYIIKNGFLEIYPVDYIPMQNKLILKTIDYKIFESKRETKIDNNKILIIYDKTLNSAFIDSISLLFRIRNKVVKSVSTDLTGNTADSIRQYIINEFSFDPFSFLLLIGTESLIPSFTGLGYDNPNTDLNYSLIDSIDYFPDIKCSRLPFDSIYLLRNYYNKLIANYSIYNINQYNNAYFIASDDPYYHDIPESTHNYSMKKFRIYGINVDSFFAYYNWGIPVDSAINDNREFVFYSGHGIAFQWQGPQFTGEDIAQLYNNKFPFIFSFACLTGNYIYRDFFGFPWLKYRDKGAIAFLGSSDETYWEEDDIFQKLIIDSFNVSGYLIDIMNKGKMGFYQHYGDSSITRAYFEQYNYFMIPDLYYGNRDINSIFVNCDRFQPYSNAIIDFSIDFTGTIDKQLYASIIKDNLIYDSLNILLPGEYVLNQNANIYDTILFSVFIPGRMMSFQDIILIPDGPYTNLYDYKLSDIVNDTFFFNLYVKNYGNQIDSNIDIFVKYMPQGLELQSNNIHIDSILPESIEVINNGLAFTLINLISDSVCTLGFVSNTDTLLSPLVLNNINPNFQISYVNAIAGNDTNNAIVFGIRNSLVFNIKNLSNLSFDNINLHFNIEDMYVFDSIVNISSLFSGESAEIVFDVYTNDIKKDSINSRIILNIGSYEDTFNFSHKFVFKNSYSFIGPLFNYYIYTNKMLMLINIPEFYDYRSIENKWKIIDFADDDCRRIELPFNFYFNDSVYNSLFLHANGILSIDSLEYSMFSTQILPVNYINQPSFFCAWQDFRYPSTSIISSNISDLNGFVLEQFLPDMNKYIILYNNVVNYNNDTVCFAIDIDTAFITLHFYKIQNSDFITGLQFDSVNAISLNYDSIVNSSDSIHMFDSLSVLFTTEEPQFYTKTNLNANIKKEPIIFGGNLFKRGTELSILFSSRDYYSIAIYDLLGRQSYKFNGVIYPSIKNIQLDMNTGVYFIIIKHKDSLPIRKKLIIF